MASGLQTYLSILGQQINFDCPSGLTFGVTNSNKQDSFSLEIWQDHEVTHLFYSGDDLLKKWSGLAIFVSSSRPISKV